MNSTTDLARENALESDLQALQRQYCELAAQHVDLLEVVQQVTNCIEITDSGAYGEFSIAGRTYVFHMYDGSGWHDTPLIEALRQLVLKVKS